MLRLRMGIWSALQAAIKLTDAIITKFESKAQVYENCHESIDIGWRLFTVSQKYPRSWPSSTLTPTFWNIDVIKSCVHGSQTRVRVSRVLQNLAYQVRNTRRFVPRLSKISICLQGQLRNLHTSVGNIGSYKWILFTYTYILTHRITLLTTSLHSS